MNANATLQPSEGHKRFSRLALLFRIVLFVVILMALLFPAAGTLNWIMGWVLIALYVLALAPMIITPIEQDLADERTSMKGNVQSWDKPIGLFLSFAPLLALPLGGLDYRFGWSSVPLWLQISGVLIFILGSSVQMWAVAVNRFFARFVRIQTDRGQTVVSDGPYRFIRHPGYSGGIVSYISMSFILGSWWTLIVAAIILAIMVYRMIREEKLLMDELPGYKEYAQRVKYRLIPGIW